MDEFDFTAMGSFSVIEPDDDKIVKCKKCTWKGEIQDCPISLYDNGEFDRLSGRKGRNYRCPQCSTTVWRYVYMMS